MKVNTTYSNNIPKLVEYIGSGNWRVRWNIEEYTETIMEDENPITGYKYEEVEFKRKPTLDEIKNVILNWFNSKIDENILSGCVWNAIPVWLSAENQFNYKAAYDLAVQTQGGNLPVTFKFGDSMNPIYYTFNTTEDLFSFYIFCIMYIQTVLEKGWKEKDSFDFSVYEKYL